MGELLNPLALALSYQESDQRRESMRNQDTARMMALESGERKMALDDARSQQLLGMKGAELAMQGQQFGETARLNRDKLGIMRDQARMSQRPVIVKGPDGRLRYAMPDQAVGMEAHDPRVRIDKPMPWGAVNKQDELLGDLSVAAGNTSTLDGTIEQMNSGLLDFGYITNRLNEAKNNLNLADDKSNAYSNFRSNMEKMRNDSLRLNKGVQTEGDAERAWNELFQNINSKDVVLARLKRLSELNKEAARIKGLQINAIRNEFGKPSIDPRQYEPQQPLVKSGTPGKAPRFLGFEPQ